ncbi:hypothetical protein D3C80_1539900 [compost metagenome]
MRQRLIDKIPAGVQQIIRQNGGMGEHEAQRPQGASLAILGAAVFHERAVIIHEIAEVALLILRVMDEGQVGMNQIQCG